MGIIGAQSFSFREFGFEDSIAQLKKLGLDCMEFCSAHFPADANDPGLEGVKESLARDGIKTPSFGVIGFGGDDAANRSAFEFAEALGAEIICAHPTADAFDNLDVLCEEFGIKIAIHNHGPDALYDKLEDTLKVVEGRSPMIGACVDTGHALRSAEQAANIIETLGDRVIAVHLKDWTIGGNEKILGEGDLDIVATAKALKVIGFTGPAILEYEESPEDPAPDMIKGLANWRDAVAQA